MSHSIENITQSFLNLYRNRNTRFRYQRVVSDYCEHAGITNLKDLKRPSESILNSIMRFCCRTDNPSVYNNRLAILKAFFDFVQVTYGARTPLNRFTCKWMKSPNKSHTPSLNRKELKKLLRVLEARKGEGFVQYRDYMMILILASTSVRISEGLRLKLSTAQSMTLEGKQISYWSIPQKGGQDRLVVLPDKLHDETKKFCDLYNVDTIICNKNGNPLDRSQAYRRIRSVVREILNIQVSPHSFRKTFIELAQDKGVHPTDLKACTGHRSIGMLDYYDGRSPLGTASKTLSRLKI